MIGVVNYFAVAVVLTSLVEKKVESPWAALVSQSLISDRQWEFSSHQDEAETETKITMKTIVIGLHDFNKELKAFPALYSQDKDHKPLLSWRVHLLPFIGEADLYKEFRLDEPWDSDHNKALIPKMPKQYAHPSLKLEPGRTVFLAIRGKDTAWPLPSTTDPCPTGIALIHIAASDQHSLTGALVEVKEEHSVIWTEPADLDIDQKDFADKLSDIWKDGRLISMCDASTHTFKADLDAASLLNLFRFNDGLPKRETIRTWTIKR